MLKTASNHFMKYYIALPDGWTKNKKWPVLISCEAAEKAFRENADRFVRARKGLPFIIVVPVITTNGNYGQHDPKVYPYTRKEWDAIDKMGTCAFDEQGLAQIIKDVRAQYAGDEKLYLTGFEAGTHLVWATTFQHPELLRAVVTVGGNYIGRCTGDQFSNDPSRKDLPIHNLVGENDTFFGRKSKGYYQYQNACAVARMHGFTNISETEVRAKGHEPLPEAVLSYFQAFL